MYKVLRTSLQLENSKNNWRPVILNTDLPLDVVCAAGFGPSARALQIFESLKSPRISRSPAFTSRRFAGRSFFSITLVKPYPKKMRHLPKQSCIVFFAILGFSARLQRACGAADHIYFLINENNRILILASGQN